MTDSIEELKKYLNDPDPVYGDDDAKAMKHALNTIEALQRENEVLRHKCEQARARLDFSVKILTRIHSFITPADVTLPDGRRFEFNNPAIEHEMLKALSAAIRAVPDELMKAGSTQPERVSDDGY